jgi:hypothetical protein
MRRGRLRWDRIAIAFATLVVDGLVVLGALSAWRWVVG